MVDLKTTNNSIEMACFSTGEKKKKKKYTIHHIK